MLGIINEDASKHHSIAFSESANAQNSGELQPSRSPPLTRCFQFLRQKLSVFASQTASFCVTNWEFLRQKLN